jgi:hypothetical protein
LFSDTTTFKQGKTAVATRVGFLRNSYDDEPSSLVLRAVYAATSQRPSKAVEFVSTLLQQIAEAKGGSVTLDFILKTAQESSLNFGSFQKAFSEVEKELKESEAAESAFVATLLGSYTSFENLVITNGRVIAVPSSLTFSKGDFLLLTQYEYNERGKKVHKAIDMATFVDVNPDDLTSEFRSDVLMKACSILSQEAVNLQKLPAEWER